MPIEYAAKNNWIKNEDFRDCHHAPSDEIKVSTENKIDFVAVLIKTSNKIRNAHAHGEKLLEPTSVWYTFEICTDFINALFNEQKNDENMKEVVYRSSPTNFSNQETS